MKGALPKDELARLEALQNYHVVDTPPEAVFDCLTRLASIICETPIAAISLVGGNRAWFKSKIGLDIQEMPRNHAFCSQAILSRKVSVISNAAADKQYTHNPFVESGPKIQFYAGAPLLTSDGHALGSLCVMDYVPREFDDRQRDILRLIAQQVMMQLEIRRRVSHWMRSVEEQKDGETEATFFQSLVSSISEANDFNDTLALLVQKMIERTGWAMGQAWVPSVDQKTLTCSTAWYSKVPALDKLRKRSEELTIHSGKTLVGGAFAGKKPMRVREISSETFSSRSTIAKGLGLKGAVALPVLFKDKVLAVLEFFILESNKDDLAKFRLLSDVSNQIGLILHYKKVEQQLREMEESYSLASQGSNDGLWDWNLKSNEVHFSRRWKTMLGYDEEEIGADPDEWFKRIHPNDVDRVRREIESHLEGYTSYFETEHRILHKYGTYRWVLSRGIALRDSKGKAYRVGGSQTDVTQHKGAEEQLMYDAFHDFLTGLPNRALFMDRLGHSIVRARRHGDKFAVLLLDVDRFKVINDSLGHRIGDELLIATSRRLESCLRPEDTVSRLGGDEFAIILDEIQDVGDATSIAERVQEELRRPFNLGGQEIFTSASIGIALSINMNDRPEDLLRDADTAMHRAKLAGKARYELFDTSMHASAVVLLELEADLRRAIERQEFVIHYQPIVSLKTGKICGAEALLRWEHPHRGMVSPVEFIPLTEETGLIVPIGEWLLYTACRQNKEWQKLGYPNLCIAINFSAVQFEHEDLSLLLEKVFKETEMEPKHLELEITESVAMKDIDFSVSTLNRLSAIGVQISIDDFGTGYSSLGNLTRFPIRILKINDYFLGDIGVESHDTSITRAILAMAHSLKLKVVAEGIETVEQLNFLREQGCDEMQGYLFSRPVPADKFTQLLKEGKSLF